MAATSGLDRLLRTHVHQRLPRPATAVRIVAGVVTVYYGVPKFTDHAGWVAGFAGFGLPGSSLLVGATGLAEVLGGLLLVVGVALLPVVAVLAVVMVGAFVFGGLVGGAAVSFTVPPLLLLAFAFVAWSAWPGVRRAPAVA